MGESNLAVHQKFISSYIIGNGSICIKCVTLLLSRGHKIYGIATSDPDVEQWARDSAISCLLITENDDKTSNKLSCFFGENSFEYLFSINNPTILKDHIFNLPEVFSINYHDSPLPKYGGINATTWAIYNQEKTHGISWHIVAKDVDAGDVLEQRSVKLSEHETVLTLNTKCYEAAIEAFQKLINNLVLGNTKKEEQDLQKRTFFSSHQQPTPACIIDWNQPANKIIALVRSLDFGVYPNRLGMPKIFINGEFIITTKIDALESKSTCPPGTILLITKQIIMVSTVDLDLAVQCFRELTGEALDASDVVKRFHLSPKFQLPRLDPDYGKCITAYTREIHKHEPYWVKKNHLIKPIQLPYIEKKTLGSEKAYLERKTLELPEISGTYQKADFDNQTLGEYILSIFTIYLARLTRIFSFDVGYQDLTIVDHRLRPIFSTCVPLRVELDDSQTLKDALWTLRDQITICKHRKTFALDIMDRYAELKEVRNFGGNLNVVISLVDDVSIIDDEVQCDADLIIEIPKHSAENNSSDILWNYKSNKISSDDILRMQQQFLVLFKNAVENPAATLVSLPLLSELEQHQMLVEWNQKQSEYPQDQLLHQLVEAQAIRTPNNKAVVFGDHYLTYGELESKSNQLANALREMGVGPEILVGIFLERSLNMIVGILGVLKAGGAYVPLNTEDPIGRLASILDNTKMKVLLTQKPLGDCFPPTEVQKLYLDADWDKDKTVATVRYDTELTVDNLAYIIYTSGSTGIPKGVMMSHRSLVNRFLWELDVFKRNEADTVLQQFSISFDYSVWEVFVALTSGACLVLAKPHGEKDSGYIAQLIRDHNISVAGFVPAMLDKILDEAAITNISSLRQVYGGGEELTVELQDKYFRMLSAPLYNGYGPTEACIAATYWTCQPDSEYLTIPIGRSMANSKTYILDEYLQPVPIGVAGELFISGVGLARGYLNLPKQTAERFLANPFSKNSEARIYKTGDLARYLPDGNIVFLGRIDNQVKIRGFRIELGEIEAALNQHPGISKAITLVRKETGNKKLVTYIVPRRKSDLTADKIRQSLKQKIPNYMLPSTFIFLDKLPLTSNGKVDRVKLPAPNKYERYVQNAHVKPQNPLERYLVKTWENIFNTKPIGVEDNFFDLGGDSLMAIEVFLEIERKLGVRWPLSTLFQAPTVFQLAEIIRQKRPEKKWSSLIPIKQEGNKPPFFIVPGPGGNLVRYKAIGKYLNPDQSLYGFQARGLDGESTPFYTVEEMAKQYINEMRMQFPTGPYMVGGHSFGGFVAIEMANQLLDSGHQVVLVALIDTIADNLSSVVDSMTWKQQFYVRVKNLAKRKNNIIQRIKSSGLKEVVKRSWRVRTRHIAKKMGWQLSKLKDESIALPDNLQGVRNANFIAIDKYELRKYPNKITLFRAEEKWPGIIDQEYYGWKRFSREVEVHDVSGNHINLTEEPNVKLLSKNLQGCIDRALKEWIIQK